MKVWEQALNRGPLTPTVSYLAKAVKKESFKWKTSVEGIITGFQGIASGYDLIFLLD